MSSIHAILDNVELPQDFESQVTNVVNQNINQLAEHEKLYLIATKNVAIHSYWYWYQNLDSWQQLIQGNTIAKASIQVELKVEPFENGSPSDEVNSIDSQYGLQHKQSNYEENKFQANQYLYSPKTYTRNPCVGAVVGADAGGILSGGVRGCITGALFGAGVGCFTAGIFWASVQGVTSSIGSAIGCSAVTR